MSTNDAQSVADQYLGAGGSSDGEGYRLALEEVAWFLGHASNLNATRLELLRSLQTALPGAGGDLKELLTDLIVMESRVAGRGERLQSLMAELKEETLPHGVPVDQRRLRVALVEILEAAVRVQSAAEESP